MQKEINEKNDTIPIFEIRFHSIIDKFLNCHYQKLTFFFEAYLFLIGLYFLKKEEYLIFLIIIILIIIKTITNKYKIKFYKTKLKTPDIKILSGKKSFKKHYENLVGYHISKEKKVKIFYKLSKKHLGIINLYGLNVFELKTVNQILSEKKILRLNSIQAQEFQRNTMLDKILKGIIPIGLFLDIFLLLSVIVSFYFLYYI